MGKRIALLGVLVLLLLAAAPVSAAPLSSTTIISVVKNESVVVRLEKFPTNQTFNVTMGLSGSQGIGGYLVSRLATNAGGTFLAKFPIPEGLVGENVIAIRFDSIDINVFWYDWFYNETAASQPAVVTQAEKTKVSYNKLEPGFPTFVATKVVNGEYITVQTKYFPGTDRWAVFMKDGALANITWYEVGGFDAADGGQITLTLPIPEQIKYKDWLAIKFYNMKTGFYTYNLIENRDYP